MTLQEVLSQYKKDILLEQAKIYGLKGAYKLKKAELYEPLAEAICHNLLRGLGKLSLPDYKYFERLVHQKRNNKVPKDYGRMRILSFLGLIAVSEDGQIVVLEEIKEAYESAMKDKKVKEALSEKQAFNQKVADYQAAALHLYGLLPMKDFTEMYCQYEGISQEDPEVYKMWETLYEHCAYYGKGYVEEGWLIDESFDYGSDEEKAYFKQMTTDRPYYRPDKEQFLRFADNDYQEQTAEMGRLSAFLNHKFPGKSEATKDILFDFYLNVSMECTPDMYFLKQFSIQTEAAGMILNSREEAEEMAGLAMQAHNSIRMWINRGFSPMEMREKNTLKVIRPQKVGRNDPCPCGSGKKYKKCCGR